MYNDRQIEAIEHNQGPALVLAGPGTGKTTVITERISRLIAEKRAAPEQLLVVTFTNAAASEMKARFRKKSGAAAEMINFGTFHSIFLRILRENGQKWQVLNDRDKERLLREIILRLGVCNLGIQDLILSLASEISKVKSVGKDIDDFESKSCESSIFRCIFKEYNRELANSRKLDFDDMILKCFELLKNNLTVRNMWIDRFKYIMVDEFQDINRIQYECLKLLLNRDNNLFVVGDDDQAIYGFRGSDNSIMLGMKKEFPGLKVITLNYNYRSNSNILATAHALIGNNDKRFEKRITAAKGEGDRECLTVYRYKNNVIQYQSIANKIEEYIRAGVSAGDIAVLTRSNSNIQIIRNHLSARQIKSHCSTKENMYNSHICRDIIAYIRCAHSDLEKKLGDNRDFLRIMNKPYRYINSELVVRNTGGFKELAKQYREAGEIMENVKKLSFHLSIIRKLTPYAAINYIKNGAGYEKYLVQYGKDNNVGITSLVSTFNKIWNDSMQFDSWQEWIEFAEENAQEKKKDKTVDANEVNIITMHASKGLEYSIVFVPDVNQGTIPDPRSVRETNVEEERRLFYVAMTRAADRLHISFSDSAMEKKLQPSQFIEEIATVT